MSSLLVISVSIFSAGLIQSKHFLVGIDSKESEEQEVGQDYVDFEYSLNNKFEGQGNDYAISQKQELAQTLKDQENDKDTKSVGGQGYDYAGAQELEQFLKEQDKRLDKKLVDGPGDYMVNSKELEQFLKDQEKELEEFLSDQENV